MTQAAWSAPATIDDPTTIPTGFTMSPREHVRKSRRWLERRYSNVIYFNELHAGGPFTALESARRVRRRRARDLPAAAR
jgi:hypothetical protein